MGHYHASFFRSLKKRNLLDSLLLIGFFGISAVTLCLYISGALSFFRRSFVTSACHASLSRSCNRLVSLSKQLPLLNQDLAQGFSGSEILYKRVVHAFLSKHELWVWGLEGPAEKYFISDRTTYGIAVSTNKEEMTQGEYLHLLNTGKLSLVDNSSNFIESEENIMFIEREVGRLKREEFDQTVKSGNLLAIVYNGNTKELIGVLLLDFKKI